MCNCWKIFCLLSIQEFSFQIFNAEDVVVMIDYIWVTVVHNEPCEYAFRTVKLV